MNAKSLLVNLNLANQLTFLRLIAIPFFVIAVLQSRFQIALGLFMAAVLTDVLDGLTARWLHQGTPLGAYLDPAADKLLLTTAFVLLTDFPSMFKEITLAQRLPVWLTTLTISRDVIIVCVSLGLFLTLHVRSFRPSVLGKLTTLAEFATVGGVLLAGSLGRPLSLTEGLIWITLGLTLLSGFDYLARTIRLIAGSGGQS